VRVNALESLGEMGEASAVGPLLACLKDRSGNICAAAAVSLGKIGEPRAQQPLFEALDDTRPLVRPSAVEALVSWAARSR